MQSFQKLFVTLTHSVCQIKKETQALQKMKTWTRFMKYVFFKSNWKKSNFFTEI